MRLLHTSDWHLGRSLHRADLGEAQQGFLEHLVQTVRVEGIDVVVVSGDIYDRAIAPLPALEMCTDALVRIRDAGARIVMISGNHDSARRLGNDSRLKDAAGVHVRTRVAGCADPVLIQDASGPVAVYAIPYLEPEVVRDELPPVAADADPLGRGHAAVLGRATAAIRADLAASGVPRSVVLAHGWVTGGAACDSERDISVGGVGAVPASLFDGFTYAALGHLHGQQTIAPHVRYSGSPLPYSFSEATHRKGSWLVEIDGAGLARVERVPAPVHRRLATVRGTLEELLTADAHRDLQDAFLEVVLTDPVPPSAPMDRLRARFPHVLVLRREPAGVVADPRSYAVRVRGRTDLQVAVGFVEHVRSPATDSEQALLAEALEQCRIAAQDEAFGGGSPAAEAGATGRAEEVA